MITNLFMNEIKAKLVNANNKDENIRITYTVKSVIDFLDVVIENRDDKLITSTFHKKSD